MKNISTKNTVLISIILAFIIFASVFMMSREKTQETIVESSPTPVAEVNEVVKDGVYTNYTYGFKFRYDENLFINVSASNVRSFVGYSQKNVGSPFDLNSEGVWFSVLVREKNDPSFLYAEDLFEEIYQNGDTNISGKALAENVKALNTNNYKRITYDFRNLPDYEGEHGFAYQAQWKKEGVPVIKISLSTNRSENLSNYRNNFQSMVESFEFIK